MEKGSSVRSQLTGRRYRLGPLLGHGGYGKAFEAEDVGNHALVCLKYTFDQMSWHREVYFGEVMRGHPRVLQVYDSFPVVPTGGMGRVRYCIAVELADHGSIADLFARAPTPWPEAKARREILGLLAVLDRLHRGSATHRDITPFNVFVCAKGRLKLGDFGVARHELEGRGVHADAFNPDFVTSGFLGARHRAWRAADDVMQMAQLFALLVVGRSEPRVRRAEVRALPVGEATRAVLRRALGPRAQRYADARSFGDALREAGPRRDAVARAR